MTLTELKSVIDNLFQTTNAAPYNGSNDFVVGVKLCPDEEDVTVEISDVVGIEFGKDWNNGKIIIHVEDDIVRKCDQQEVEIVPIVQTQTVDDSELVEDLKKQVRELQELVNQLKS